MKKHLLVLLLSLFSLNALAESLYYGKVEGSWRGKRCYLEVEGGGIPQFRYLEFRAYKNIISIGGYGNRLFYLIGERTLIEDEDGGLYYSVISKPNAVVSAYELRVYVKSEADRSYDYYQVFKLDEADQEEELLLQCNLYRRKF